MSAAKAESLALQRVYHWEGTSPDRIALSQPMGGGVVRDFTWGRVADQVRRMDAHLKAQGWEPGSKVAILSKNCAWWLMSDLAIWMAGHVLVPLYPTLTSGTVTRILTTAKRGPAFVGKLDGWEGMKPGVPAGLPACRASATRLCRRRTRSRASRAGMRSVRATRRSRAK